MNRHFFTEYEAYAEAVREASVTMRITSLEETKWTLQHAIAGALRLQQGYEGGGSLAEGATSRRWVDFYQQSRPVHANGQVALRMRFSRYRREVSFVWLANPVTSGSRS